MVPVLLQPGLTGKQHPAVETINKVRGCFGSKLQHGVGARQLLAHPCLHCRSITAVCSTIYVCAAFSN